MTESHRSTPEQWRNVELADIRDRLTAAEQRISELDGTCHPVIHGNGATHPLQLAAGCRHEADSYPIGSPLRILLSDAAETLEILAPAAGPRIAEQRISELEAKRPAAADTAPARSLEESVGNVIPLLPDGRVNEDSARAVILAVADWLDVGNIKTLATVASWLRMEVERHD